MPAGANRCHQLGETMNPCIATATRKGLPRLISLLGSLLLLSCGQRNGPQQTATIRVGILHSRTGTMALSEATVAEAERLAIEEINAAGGLKLNGRLVLVEPIEEDGMSDPAVFARKAQRMLNDDKVVAIFGGWTSASRKAMVPVMEASNRLLFYPVQYEGQECSSAVVYGGSVPNQQSEPALNWMLNNHSKRLLLIGSDYVYPRTANRIIRAQAEREQARVLKEHYLPLGSEAVQPLIADIQSALNAGPVAVVNTLNGDSNIAFFQALQRQGLNQRSALKVLSLSVSEEEAVAIGKRNIAGTYASWSYFQSLQTPESAAFAQRFRQRYGFHRVINDPAEAGYSLVHLWAQAVETSGSVETDAVRQALIGSRFTAPQGDLQVSSSLHLKKRSLLAQADPKGGFRVLKDFGVIEPKPWNPALPESAGATCDHRDPPLIKE